MCFLIGPTCVCESVPVFFFSLTNFSLYHINCCMDIQMLVGLFGHSTPASTPVLSTSLYSTNRELMPLGNKFSCLVLWLHTGSKPTADTNLTNQRNKTCASHTEEKGNFLQSHFLTKTCHLVQKSHSLMCFLNSFWTVELCGTEE